LSVYVDGESVSKYARYSMGWAEGFGFIKGNGNRINPAGKLTRAEAASILTRFCEEFMPDFGVPTQEEEAKEKTSRREWEEQRDKQFRIVYGIAKRHGLYLKWDGNSNPCCGDRWEIFRNGECIGRIQC